MIQHLRNETSVFTAAGDRLLRVSAVARRLHCTCRMVRYLAEKKLIPAIKRGKLWFFKQSDIEHYCQSIRRPRHE
jgi:excisionase family DNA binding protein